MNKHKIYKNNNESIKELYSTTNESVCSYVQGKNVDIEISKDDVDIRLDFKVERKIICKLWGQVKDTDGNCIEGIFVMLLKPQYIRGNIEYIPISTTISDSMGFYQFEIDKIERGLKYRVSLSK